MRDAAQLHEFYRQVGERLRKVRKQRCLSQEALARLVGLTRTSLTNIESGRQHPPLHTFCEIAEQLEADLSELLPRSPALATTVDVGVLAGAQVRGRDELAFIQTGIRITGRDLHADTTTENPGDDRRATR